VSVMYKDSVRTAL